MFAYGLPGIMEDWVGWGEGPALSFLRAGEKRIRPSACPGHLGKNVARFLLSQSSSGYGWESHKKAEVAISTASHNWEGKEPDASQLPF